MSNKFLNGGSNNLSDGTTTIYSAILGADNLTSGMPVKANASQFLVSQKLNIDDTLNLQAELDAKISNPLSSDLDFQTFDATNITNLSVIDTITCDTLEAKTYIVEEELKIQDPLIELAVGNPNNNFNLGFLEEWNDGAPKWSGLLRSKDDNKQYLLEGVETRPTNTDNITSFSKGSLVVDDLFSEGLIVQKTTAGTLGGSISSANGSSTRFSFGSGNTSDTTVDVSSSGVSELLVSGSTSKLQLGSTGNETFNIFNDGTDELKISTSTTDVVKLNINTTTITNQLITSEINVNGAYTLPAVDGTAGQVQQTNGAGIVTWETPTSGSNPTIQDTYDNSASPQILTDVTNQTMVIRQRATPTAGEIMLDLQDDAGTSMFNYTNEDAEFLKDLKLKESNLLFTTNTGNQRWAIKNVGDLTINNSTDTSVVSISSSGLVVANGNIHTNEIDTISGVTLSIGRTNATFIEIGDSGASTGIAGDLISLDSKKILLNNTATLVPNCVCVKLSSGSVFPTGRLLKIINNGGVAAVTQVLPSDPDNLAFGVSVSESFVVGDTVDVAIGGTFLVTLAFNASVLPGNFLEKSDDLGQEGRVFAAAASVGTVAIALTGGVGDVGGTVSVLALFKKAESF